MPSGNPIEIDFGKIYYNKRNEAYRIIEEVESRKYDNHHTSERMVKIKFLDSGYEIVVTLQNALNRIAADYSKFIAIYGEKYLQLKGKLNPLDRKILKILYNIVSRCHNPDYEDYYRYGGRGVKVCDEWRFNPEQFISDFKTLPGYNSWLNAYYSTGDTSNFHIDKDMLQQDVPVEQRVYSKATCCIIPNQLNSRIKTKEGKSSQYIGVNKNRESGTWSVAIIHNKIEYRLGIYSNEIAAASVFNYVARNLPNTILNDLGDQEMSIYEALKYLTSYAPLIIPNGVYLPEYVNNKKINYVYDGSVYAGVKKTIDKEFRAFAMIDSLHGEILIGTYTNELAAANAVNYYYIENGFKAPNLLTDINKMTMDQVNSFKIMPKAVIAQQKRLDCLQARLDERYVVGETYTNDNGRQYTVLKRPDINDINTRHFPVTIRYEDTQEVVTLSTSTLERQRTIIHERTRKDTGINKNPYEPTLYGVGCLGETVFPKEEKYIRIIKIWRQMFNCASEFGKRVDKLQAIDPKWRNLSYFAEDIQNVFGYRKWEAAGFPKGWTIENKSRQMYIEPDQRLWNVDLCTIVTNDQLKIYTAKDPYYKYNMMHDPSKGIYKNVFVREDGSATAKCAIIGSNKTIHIGTFDNPRMAAAAVDYYSQFYNGISYNGLFGVVDPREWLQHKSGIRQMYKLIDTSAPDYKPKTNIAKILKDYDNVN